MIVGPPRGFAPHDYAATILQIAASGNEKSKCFLNRVLLASIVHIYSELYVNPLKNKDMGAEKLF